MSIKPTDPDYSSTLHACEKCGSLYVGNHGRYRCDAMRWKEGHLTGVRCDGQIRPLTTTGAQSPTAAYLASRMITQEFTQFPTAPAIIAAPEGEPQNSPTGQPSPITQPIVSPDPRTP